MAKLIYTKILAHCKSSLFYLKKNTKEFKQTILQDTLTFRVLNYLIVVLNFYPAIFLKFNQNICYRLRANQNHTIKTVVLFNLYLKFVRTKNNIFMRTIGNTYHPL